MGEAAWAKGGGGGGGGGVQGSVEGGVGAIEEVGRSQEEEECRKRPITTLDVGCSTIDTLVIGNACSSSGERLALCSAYHLSSFVLS